MQIRAPIVVLLLTAAAYLIAAPGGLAPCIGSQRPAFVGVNPNGVSVFAPRGNYGACIDEGIPPLGLGITALVVALQGRKGRPSVTTG